MSTNKIDVVGEYLREVELRLSGLPLLQRRELLADLTTHIETARVERNIQSEGEMIEVLERLGSPEVVAAAAYEEGGPAPMGPAQTPRPAEKQIWVRWLIAGAVAFVVLFLIGLAALFFVGGERMGAPGIDGPMPARPPATLPFDPAPTN